MSLSLRLSGAALCVLGVAQFTLGQQADSTSPPTPSVSVQPRKLPDDVEQVLWWLPEETEAVLVSKGNVPIKEFRPATPPKAKGSAPYLAPRAGYVYPTLKFEYQDLVAMECIEPVGWNNPKLFPGDMPDKMTTSFYGPKTASLFVKAVWWDKDATREICDIVVFRDNMARRIIDTLATFPNTPRNVAGVHVLEVDLNYGHHGETMRHIPFDLNDLGPIKPKRRYLAAPRPNVYVAATNSELMKVIIERMKRRGANRALPPDLPEWRQLDPTVPAWGLRHYRPAIANKDCLSMLKWDPNAKGLIFFGGNKPSPFIGLRYVSNSEDAGSRFLRMQADWFHIKDISKMVPMQRISTNCVESRTRINVSPAEVERKPWKTLSVETTSMCMDTMYLPWLGFSCPKLAIQGE